MDKSDLFGEALIAYSNGDRNVFFIQNNDIKEKHEHNLKRYFRKTNQLSKTEEKIITLSFGEILDIGCGTGHYIPNLMKKGNVIGIDISAKTISIAHKNGLQNCKVADIFNFKSKGKFDTITLFENNLGMAGTLEKTKKLLKILTNLLNKNGQILTTISNRGGDSEYFETTLIPIFKGIKGDPFKWINFNSDFLSKLCSEKNLDLSILSSNRYYKLIKIVKK